MTTGTRPPLRRPVSGKVIGGVCAAFGDYFGLDPVLVRVAWVVFVLLGGSGVLAYLLAWYIIPNQEGRRENLPLILLAVFVVLPIMCGCIAFSLGLLGEASNALVPMFLA